jgi:hypothetical protein
MNRAAAFALSAALPALLLGCPPKPEQASLPPAGLAGMPAGHGDVAAPVAGQVIPGEGRGDGLIPIPEGAGLPPGHPPIGQEPAALPDPRLPSFPAGPGAAPAGGLATPGAGIGDGVVFSGEVLEKFDVPSYTYFRVKAVGGSDETWVAVSTMPLNVGDRVMVNQQLVMEDFASKALNRTFPRLVMGTATVSAD